MSAESFCSTRNQKIKVNKKHWDVHLIIRFADWFLSEIVLSALCRFQIQVMFPVFMLHSMWKDCIKNYFHSFNHLGTFFPPSRDRRANHEMETTAPTDMLRQILWSASVVPLSSICVSDKYSNICREREKEINLVNNFYPIYWNFSNVETQNELVWKGSRSGNTFGPFLLQQVMSCESQKPHTAAAKLQGSADDDLCLWDQLQTVLAFWCSRQF